MAQVLDKCPVWWTDTVFPKVPETALSSAYDVVVIGAGYTGLNAALETARAGRSTLVLEAKTIGTGCSSRNGGQIGTSLKPDFKTLAKRHGIARANAITEVPHQALDWLEGFLEREGGGCGFARVGRYHGAHTPHHFEALVDKALGRSLPAGAKVRTEGVEVVSRREQDAYIGTRAYYGGVLLKSHASLQPAHYLAALLERALGAGVVVREGIAARAIERQGDGFLVRTGTGDIRARDVLVATNGYSGNLVPWLARRIIPIGSYMMASLVLAHSLLALPLVLIVVASGLKSYDMNQEMAARSLGASRVTAFFTVTLPQIRFSVVTAALLAFLTSFDEVVVAMFLSGGDNATLTRNMFNALRDQIDPTIAAISTIMIVVTTLLMVLAQVLGRSR